MPLVPVAWGELIDKIAILEIKVQRLRRPEARASAARQLAALQAACAGAASPELDRLATALRRVNLRLWDIEDAIREKEARQDFGPDFVALARSVYRSNDERARLKREIDRLLGSDLTEEKQYTPYP
jgi:hypothetical protein